MSVQGGCVITDHLKYWQASHWPGNRCFPEFKVSVVPACAPVYTIGRLGIPRNVARRTPISAQCSAVQQFFIFLFHVATSFVDLFTVLGWFTLFLLLKRLLRLRRTVFSNSQGCVFACLAFSSSPAKVGVSKNTTASSNLGYQISYS